MISQIFKPILIRNFSGRGICFWKNNSALQITCKNLFSTDKCGLDRIHILPPPPNTKLNAILDNLHLNKHVKIDVPLIPFNIEKVDTINKLKIDIEEPVIPNQTHEKHAILMIIKRRRKMKKHKLKKLRKRMKFEWAKIKHKRDTKKEKAFQIEMSSKVKEGDRFSAEQYVENKLRLLHAEQLHEKWNNVPEWFIKEWKGRKQRVKNEKEARRERRKALHSVLVRDWGVDFLKNQ